ncbi:MAG: hypothetical protein H0U49_08595 [Parachlamydiaceae bacterium]|nr:hypothetical protein [Parachlamydiaceae bacterium]
MIFISVVATVTVTLVLITPHIPLQAYRACASCGLPLLSLPRLCKATKNVDRDLIMLVAKPSISAFH